MRELLVVIRYGLMYLLGGILAAAAFVGVLYLLSASAEWAASVIPDWLALSGPSLIVLAALFLVCGGRRHEQKQ